MGITKIEVELTPSEKEISLVKMLSDGINQDSIAEAIGQNKFTMATELAALRQRYQCKNSTHLVAFFLRNGLIT